MRDLDTVLFDLDGTLTDSEPGIAAGVVHVLESMGRPIPDAATLRRHIGPPLVWGFRELEGMSTPDAERAGQLYREYYNDIGWSQNRVYPGIEELLDALAAADLRLGVATAKQEPIALRVLEHFGLIDRFRVVVGAALDERAADKSAIVAEALTRMKAQPALAAMVGDRHHDFEAAAAARIAPIAVTWGYGDAEEWALAELAVSSAAELARVLLGAAAPLTA